MRYWLTIIYSLFIFCNAFSQNNNIQKVEGLPSDEVYDIFSDTKGYIWVGHGLGLSRYDGHAFTNFENPGQYPLGVTNICEDLQGRIWCHNFNGQVYFIEHEKMHLFEPYQSLNEESFPTMMILDSELVITSSNGLFICNTKTLKSVYLKSAEGPSSSKSLAAFGNTIITFNYNDAFKYQSGKGLRKLKIVPKKGLIYSKREIWFTLAPLHTKDTLYGFNNERLFTFIERNDTLFILNIDKAPATINTITSSNKIIWINTKKNSFAKNDTGKIFNQNLSDIVIDNRGDTWYGSLQWGLSVNKLHKAWQQSSIPRLHKSDFIRSMFFENDLKILGTQKGNIKIFEKDHLIYQLYLPANAGSAEYIFKIKNKGVLVAASIGLYFVNIDKRKLTTVCNFGTVKDITLTDTTMLLAQSQNLIKVTFSALVKNYLVDPNFSPSAEHALINELRGEILNPKIVKQSRCYKVNYDIKTKNTFTIFSNGFARIKNDSISYLLYKNKTILSSSLVQFDDKVYIGSLNNGLLVFSRNTPGKIMQIPGTFTNTVLKMKLFNNHLCLIEPGWIQILDINKHIFINNIPYPGNNSGNVYDFIEKDEELFIDFTNAFYKLDLHATEPVFPPAYLSSAINMAGNTPVLNNMTLSFHENNILINLSSPSYLFPEATYFEYRLLGTYDHSWKKIFGPIYSISFPSLEPGTYRLEAYAVNFQNHKSRNLLALSFIIDKPWWQKWWFILLCALVFCILVGSLFYQRFRQLQIKTRTMLENLSLQNELRKSQLKTIISQMNPHFIFNALNTIQSFVYQNDKRSVSNYMGKFSELIRKILDSSKIDTITLKEEIEILNLYLDLERVRFEDDFKINMDIDPELDIENIDIPPMLIQPFIENSIKHGLFHKKGLKHLNIKFQQAPGEKEYITIVITDDGIGRNNSQKFNSTIYNKHSSFASTALYNRIALINQTLKNKILLSIIDIQNDQGTIVTIQLPVINQTI